MTLHLVLDPARARPSLTQALLALAGDAAGHGIPCTVYVGEPDAALPLPARPLSELAFASHPEDVLLWCCAGEMPSLHLGERVPGIRVLLCDGVAVGQPRDDGEVAAAFARAQLESLTCSYERVYGADAEAAAALRQLGFAQPQIWPEGSAAPFERWLAEIRALPRLRRTGHHARVSVVVCTLNRAEHLESCLLQLRRQRYARFEVIVVNGPSTDETEEVLARFRGEIKVRRNPHANLCMSRNLGIAAAAGDIIAFLDDDSFAHPDWMHEALVAFDDPLTAAVGGLSYRLRDEATEFANGLLTDTCYPWPIQAQPGSHHRGEDGLWNTATGNNCLFRRESLLAVGGFDERFPYAHDESNVVMKLARRGLRTRHRPLAVVHHGSQPGLNRRSEFDLNWAVIVRDSIYCGFRSRPTTAAALPFLLRTVWEHARHRLYDPIDWWLYRKVSFGGFLSIEWKCLQGLARGVAKALTARPRPLSPELQREGAEAFLPWPSAARLEDGSVVHSSFYAPFRTRSEDGTRTRALAEALMGEGFLASVVVDGSPALLDSRRGVSYHSVPPASADVIAPALSGMPETVRTLGRSVAVWRKMQELAVRQGARILVSASGEAEGLVTACDTRFLTVAVATGPKQQTLDLEEREGNEDFQRALEFEGEVLRRASAVVVMGAGSAEMTDILVPTGEPRALVDGVLRVMGDAVAWNQMVLAARQRCEAEFTEARIGKRFAELLRRVAAERNAHSPLMATTEGSDLEGSAGVTRWRDPLYGRDYQQLPADGCQYVCASWRGLFPAGECRLDLFFGVVERCAPGVPIGELAIGIREGRRLASMEFGGRHLGESPWGVVSLRFSLGESTGPLCARITNVGFTILRVQRMELWRLPAKAG